MLSPPRGQTADPGSSAEFMCQLEIAHGAQTLPRTSAIRDELSQHHNLTRSLMILKCCILRWHNCATASVWDAVTASSDSLQCSENMKTDLTLLCRTNKPNRNTQKSNFECEMSFIVISLFSYPLGNILRNKMFYHSLFVIILQWAQATRCLSNNCCLFARHSSGTVVAESQHRS